MTKENTDIIIFIPQTNEDCINAQKISFDYGFGWGLKTKQVVRDSNNFTNVLIFKLSKKRISYMEYLSIKQFISAYEYHLNMTIGEEDILKDLNTLKYLLSGKKIINYNKPKILIYD